MLKKKITFSKLLTYTVDYTYCPDEPTPRVPEPYERVENFEKCLTEVFIPDKPTRSFCLPATRPNNCPNPSWKELKTLWLADKPNSNEC